VVASDGRVIANRLPCYLFVDIEVEFDRQLLKLDCHGKTYTELKDLCICSCRPCPGPGQRSCLSLSPPFLRRFDGVYGLKAWTKTNAGTGSF